MPVRAGCWQATASISAARLANANGLAHLGFIGGVRPGVTGVELAGVFKLVERRGHGAGVRES